MIYLASDHGGFDLKNKIKNFLIEKGYELEDIGPYSLDPSDDYPDFAAPLASKVLENTENTGILVCRNGVGMCMAANKIKGIKCGLSWNAPHAISHRRDDASNVLAIPADYIRENEALEIVEAWVNSSFSRSDRHKRRLQKVEALE